MIERLELAAAYTVITMALTVSIAVAVRGNDFTGEVDGATPPSEEQQVSVTDSPVIDTNGDAGEGEDGADSGDQAGGADSGDQAGGVDGDSGDVTGAVDGEDPEEGADDPGCVEALSDNAQSQEELGDHVADADTPAGGVDGNQNALDSQCGGAFAEEPPVIADDTAAEDADDTPAEGASAPGKSEQANGGGNGNANGGGQGNADSNGNGPSGAPGHNKP